MLPGALITKFSRIALQATSGMEIDEACSYCKNRKCCFSVGLSCWVVCSRGFSAVC